MPHIVTEAEFLEYLGEPALTPQMAVALDDAEALFERAVNKVYRPTQTGRVEVHDGTGSNTLLLDYNIAALTSVKLGYDVNNPYVTLDVADQTVLNWAVGSNRLVRISGDFGRIGMPRYVHVTYNTQSNISDAAKAAVRAGAKLLLDSAAGASGDVKSESFGPYAVTYDVGSSSSSSSGLDSLPAWQEGKRAERGLVYR